ncbi:MAG: TMEM165/GDT1 family protein [Nitrososphaerota archaeon]|jgi:putative Ca2+/H+ antiporter (TMEM165/GDT1 family)|nr:TMEM165/GDT1 family protein [Nitrososphaerota archaeon]MDG7009987.1 TMEM165/GDT1 family protein [Nitrososphaerota archaeon]MDG7019012.1 TMEM165/GDT1 family protein [Nitrososphaerota archaeon]
MNSSTLYAFFGIAAALFVAELTDKDAFLLLAVSAKVKARVAFLAGATAFVLTTTLFVGAGSLLLTVVPVAWVRLAGGAVMLGYGGWQARGLVGYRTVEEEESRVERSGTALGAFLTLVASLAFLDIAGDATEVLTVVLVSKYSDLLFVFTAVCTGLIAATAFETALGNRLGRLLTPRRLRVVSAAVFLALGVAILVSGA